MRIVIMAIVLLTGLIVTACPAPALSEKPEIFDTGDFYTTTEQHKLVLMSRKPRRSLPTCTPSRTVSG